MNTPSFETLHKIVLVLARDPDYSTAFQLKKIIDTCEVQATTVLEWMIEAGFYKPGGIVKIGSKTFGISKERILESALRMQQDETTYRKLLHLKAAS